MATTAQYLEQLQADKQMLVDNLVAKGIEATNDETFTSLVPKVGNISTGIKGKIYSASYLFYNNYRMNLMEELCALIDESCELFEYMFYGCTDVENIPSFPTSNAVSLKSLCADCKKLKKSNIDTSNATDLSYLYANCESLEEIVGLDTSNATITDNMLYGCKSLISVSPLNMQNVTKINSMVNNSAITALTLLNTGNVTQLNYAIYNVNSLVDLSEIDASSVVVCTQAIRSSSLVNFPGFKDLGKSYLPTQSANFANYAIYLNYCPKLSEESLISILNNLYDIASNGCQTQKANLGSANLAKLTSDAGQQAIANATAKGWTVS